MGIVAVGMFLCSCYRGFRRGLVKEIIAFVSIFVAMAFVWALNPYVDQFLRENTEIYQYIEETVEKAFEKSTIQNTEPDAQENFIDEMLLPEFMKKNIQDNNNVAGYQKLAVDSFEEYISGYIVDAIEKCVSFIVTFILIIALIKVTGCILDILVSFPVLKQTNQIAGAFLGGGKFIILLWFAFIIMSVLGQTTWGKTGLELIEQDSIMKILYDNNWIMEMFLEKL